MRRCLSGRRSRLSHVDARGPDPHGGRRRQGGHGARSDRATGTSACRPAALRQIRAGGMKKGDPLETARLAGIMAAKQTSALIPLCHPLPLVARRRPADSRARTATTSKRACARRPRPGVEMEALTAVAVAALTVYDMVKAVDKGMVIGDIRLLEKTAAAAARGARNAMNVLVAIYSPCRRWRIPEANVEWLRARVPGSRVRASRRPTPRRWPPSRTWTSRSARRSRRHSWRPPGRLRWIHSPRGRRGQHALSRDGR